MFPGFRLAAASLILASTMFLACSTDPTTAPAPHPAPAFPVADSPSHAVDLLKAATENRSFDSYRTLFTSDFVFTFSALDTNGNAYRNSAWTRDNELLSFQHLAAGGGEVPPASLITLILDRQYRVTADPRPGKDATRNKRIESQVNLTVQLTDGTTMNINGKCGLYLVRGDAAAIPADLGQAPDSTLWYVERWEDLTFAPALMSAGGSPIAQAQPIKSSSWGSLKALYLESAPAAAAIATRP